MPVLRTAQAGHFLCGRCGQEKGSLAEAGKRLDVDKVSTSDPLDHVKHADDSTRVMCVRAPDQECVDVTCVNNHGLTCAHALHDVNANDLC